MALAGNGGNVITDIRSHSSILYNDRINTIFLMLDDASINLISNDYNKKSLKNYKAIVETLYGEVRTLIRFDKNLRYYLNLDTKVKGVYVTDVMLKRSDDLLLWCVKHPNQWTFNKNKIIYTILNDVTLIIKDILQYYKFFVRHNIKQKPDILTASNEFKNMADKFTIEQLKAAVGKNHKIDFNEFAETDALLKKRSELEDEDEE